MTRRLALGLLFVAGAAAQLLAVACVWGGRAAVWWGALGLGSLGLGALTRLGLKEREASLEGRTANRLVGLFWRARRALGRAGRTEPLYLVVGAQGAGKTALLQAGLGTRAQVFEAAPAPEAQARLISGQGRAFLEVPSRLLEEGQAPRWRSFLRTLWWLGAARRIKGVLWVQDINTMGANMPPPPPHWRAVMAAVVDVLGVRPPVYMVLSHSDAVPGFKEAFAQAAPAVQRAPWGFAIDDRDETALVSGHRFDALLDALRAFTLVHLAQGESVGARAPLYLFPQYVATLRRGLMHRVETIFGTQAQTCGPRLGGLYLVAVPPPPPASVLPNSSAQKTALDDFGASHALNAGWDTMGPAPETSHEAWPAAAPAPSGFNGLQLGTAQAEGALPGPALNASTAPFFVQGLLTDVLAHDVHLDTTVRRAGLWRELMRAPVQLTVMALVLSTAGLVLVSCVASLTRINELGRVVALPWDHQDGPAQDNLLPLIRAAEHSPSAAPLERVAHAFGLGDSAARDAARALFARVMQRDLLGPLLAADRDDLAQVWRRHAYAGTAPEQAAATQAAAQLRTHLLLTGPKAAHEPLMGGRQAAWLSEALRARLAAHAAAEDTGADVLLRRHLALYVQVLADQPALAMPRNETLVSRSRALLQRRPTADLLIDGLVFDAGLITPSVRLDDIITAGTVPLSGATEVPAAFTQEGYSNHAEAWLRAQETDSDAWIFWEAEPKDKQRRAIGRAVRARYFSRYIEAWRTFLASLTWREPGDVHGGHAMLVALTRSEPPPLRALLRTLAIHTDLRRDRGLTAAAEGMMGALRRRMAVSPSALDGEDAVGAAGGGQEPSEQRMGPDDVARAFLPLLAFGGASAQPEPEREQKALLGSYQELLLELRGAVENFIEAPQESDSLMQDLRRARTRAAGLIQASPPGSGTRAVLQQLLLVPLDHMTRALTRGVRAQVVEVWCPAVVQPFAQLARRYPFDPAGPDASLEDVAAFFHPTEGHAWRFYEEHLRHDVLRQADGFVFDEKMGGVIKRTYRPQLLDYYGQLLAAGQALFSKGAQEGLAADFDVRLMMDKELWETRVDLEGIIAHVVPGRSATPWQRVHWPHAGGGAPASLVMVGVGGVKERLDFEGPWALWHLMESGRMQLDRATGIMTITWRPGGILGHARLEIRPTRHHNPFFVRTRPGQGGGVFEYLRSRALRPPQTVGVGARACP